MALNWNKNGQGSLNIYQTMVEQKCKVKSVALQLYIPTQDGKMDLQKYIGPNRSTIAKYWWNTSICWSCHFKNQYYSDEYEDKAKVICLISTGNRLYEWQDWKGWDMPLKLKVETLNSLKDNISF